MRFGLKDVTQKLELISKRPEASEFYREFDEISKVYHNLLISSEQGIGSKNQNGERERVKKELERIVTKIMDF